MQQVSIQQLFEETRHKLELAWVAGVTGGANVLNSGRLRTPELALMGHLNVIHPNRIQVLGVPDIAYLLQLTPEGWHQLQPLLFRPDLTAIFITNGVQVPDFLKTACYQFSTPLLTSPLDSARVMEIIRAYLARALAESTSLHGVFLDVLGLGVLITGASAMGKSELALELISRGHGLVADDVVDIYRVAPETLEGRCPAMLRDFLEVRGLGILNIRTVFGETAVRPKKVLRLILHLEKFTPATGDIDRLQMQASKQDILGVPVQKVTIPVAAGRNLAVLAETAVRNCILQLRGIDSTQEFLLRHQQMLMGDEQPPLADDFE